MFHALSIRRAECCHVALKQNRRRLIPTRRKLRRVVCLKGRADVTVSLNPKYQMLLTITIIIRVNVNSTCHIRATQALVRVRVALSRGLVSHVASTWVRAINAPFCFIFNNFNVFKIEINSYKFHKKSYKL